MFYVGLDLGQASDFTALAVLERTEYAVVDPQGRARRAASRYDCRHLERMPLGTPYPSVAERALEVMRSPMLRGRAVLVVDATGVGRPVVDMLRNAGLPPVAVTITGGDTATRDTDGGHRVPKRALVSTVQVLLQSERLRFAASLPTVPKLVQELRDFKVKINALTAHDSYGSWREGSHDDMVLAVAVAAWYAETHPTPGAWIWSAA